MADADTHPPMPAGKRPSLLFTAFEPSGDDHASVVIAEIKRRHPDLPIFAWGGIKMQRAGAELIERTGDEAVIGMPGLAKIIEHWRINRRIDAFLADNVSSDTPIVAHIPVDSPAANGPICEVAKKRGLKVIHLVAPQIWAWGRWRIHKLRRRTDLVLCVLAFEEEFFKRRNVPAKFIGHFLFDEELDTSALDARAHSLGEGTPRIALFPGSRPNELDRHLPILLDAFRMIRASFPHAVGVVAATTPAVADRLRRAGTDMGGWPEGVSIAVGETDAVVRWCDLALVKSGTITLQVARQGKPMVVFYKRSSQIPFLIFRIALSTTKHFSLPNIIANRRVVPELIPHWGGPEPIAAIAQRLLHEPDEARAQTSDVAETLAPYKGLHASRAAADEILRVAGITPASPG